MDQLFSKEKSSASGLAWASLIYSLVPYLGILFLPFMYILAGSALFSGVAKNRSDIAWDAVKCLLIGSVILLVQVVLWWLLFMIPVWAGYQTSYI